MPPVSGVPLYAQILLSFHHIAVVATGCHKKHNWIFAAVHFCDACITQFLLWFINTSFEGYTIPFKCLLVSTYYIADGRHSFPILQLPGYEVSNRILYLQQRVPQQNIRLIQWQLWIPRGVKRKEVQFEQSWSPSQAYQHHTWAQIIITEWCALIASSVIGDVECLPKTKHVLHSIDGPAITKEQTWKENNIYRKGSW